MRVLHVIPSVSDLRGGPSYAVRTMERALLAQGVQIELATTDDDGDRAFLKKPLNLWVREDGAVRRYFHRSTRFYMCSWTFARWIVRHARDYDLLHIHALFSFTSTVAAWAARWHGVPYVIRPLGVLNRYGILNRRPYLKKLSIRILEAPILRRAAAVHFTSAAEAREAADLNIRLRSVVIPLALDRGVAQNMLDLATILPEIEGKRIVLFLSRLDAKKNVIALIRAFAGLVRRHADLQLVIAGTGDKEYERVLRREVDRLGIGRSVTWTGFVRGVYKSALLQKAEVFALPSFSENFGIAAAEALAAGLPCVVGHGVALSEAIVRAGAGVAVGQSPDEIEAGLLHVLDSRERRADMATRALALAQSEFSDIVMGERLHQFYKALLAEVE